ncbi:MAG: chitobiase/beta-hexosaminidase C-terminal domain-containing protein [Leptospiraceae bacterium]|nr:chitobiase/beta-hexosaminidase C-terminal domain-containing protein [Leptospiraceae bacterium]
MKSILKVVVLFLLISLQDCNVTSPCNQLDSTCNPISSLVLERQIRSSRNPLTFLPVGGTYRFDQFVSIVSGTQASVIRYTTDGSEPTCWNGTVYTDPVPLVGAKTHLLKAAVCVDSMVANTKTDQYIVSQSPLSAQNLRFWYSADSIGIQNGMEVKVWNDFSGSGNHLYTSSISSSNPTLVANALNGKPSVRFNSNQKQFMNTRTMNGYTGAKTGTGVMVLKKYSSQSEEVYFSIGFLGNSVNARNWRANLSNPSICSSLSPSLVNCAAAANTAISTTSYSVILFTIDSAGAVTYYYNGNIDGTSTLATPTSFSAANTMLLGSGLNVSTFLDAEVLEVLFFEQGFDVTGINVVHCYIQSKYGLAVGTNCQ